MKCLARVLVSAFVLLGCLPEASAQLAPGEPETNFTLADWVTGVNNVTDIAFMRDGRGIITTKTGQVVVVDRDGAFLKRPAFTFTVDTASEKGLLGVVRDSDDNLYFYASTGDQVTDKHRVYKGQVAEDGTVTVDLEHPIVTGGLEGPANHDGGGMVIHKGQLYIGVGDTGANATPPRNMYAACLNRPNGKVLRVNLDGSIPSDNPLSGLDAVTGCAVRVGGTYGFLPPDKRIYAWGFRNPWRIWIDPKTNLLWVGDVGETTQEEITVGGNGSNHGWPFNEGTRAYPVALGGLNDCMQMTPARSCVPPQDSYAHDAFMGRTDASVTGGLVPSEGCGWGAYENKYFFGDYNRGPLWTLDLKPDRSGVVPGSRALFATLGGRNNLVSIRLGPDGALYLAAYSQGAVKRIAPKNVPSTCVAAAPTPDPTTPNPTTPPNGNPGTPSAGAKASGCSLGLSTGSSGVLAVGLVLLVGAGILRRRRR